jgi:hypothetical protein
MGFTAYQNPIYCRKYHTLKSFDCLSEQPNFVFFLFCVNFWCIMLISICTRFIYYSIVIVCYLKNRAKQDHVHHNHTVLIFTMSHQNVKLYRKGYTGVQLQWCALCSGWMSRQQNCCMSGEPSHSI